MLALFCLLFYCWEGVEHFAFISYSVQSRHGDEIRRKEGHHDVPALRSNPIFSECLQGTKVIMTESVWD